MSVAATQAPHVQHYREHGYAIVRGLFSPDEMAEAQAEAQRIYALGLEHHATWRHKNLLYEILPESYAGRRCMLQAHWYAWVSPLFERMRRDPRVLAVIVLPAGGADPRPAMKLMPVGLYSAGYCPSADFSGSRPVMKYFLMAGT